MGTWFPGYVKYDLVHSFNKIPVVNKPWIVTFESMLPRTIGAGAGIVYQQLRPKLLEHNCRKLIAMSEYARRRFIDQNREWTELEDVLTKLIVVHPNLPLRVEVPKTYSKKEVLDVIFVGNDFAQKGGIVMLRLAKKAFADHLPIKFHVVSRLNCGPKVFADYPDMRNYQEDLNLLRLPNVTFHGTLPNSELLRLMSTCHIQLLATLDDTYGFSVLEGFSVGIPAVTTDVCALPEFVKPGVTGLLLSLDKNHIGRWKFLTERNRSEYWDILDETYERLSNQALDALVTIAESGAYEFLSAGALQQVRTHHNSIDASRRLDLIYSACLEPKYVI